MKTISFIITHIFPILTLACVLYGIRLTLKSDIKRKRLVKKLKERIGPRLDVNGQSYRGTKKDRDH